MDSDTNNGYFHMKIARPTVEIPPRKLLFSGKKLDTAEKETEYDSDGEDPYGTDSFRMYEFKIRRCTRSRSHDWTDCPFAHPGEKARRRDPRRWAYSGEPCPEFRRGGGCGVGDECTFAHGVFESWLHPSRYRTEACKDGKGCKRKVCFFAHTPRQLRVPSPDNVSPGGNGGESSGKSPCCMFCRHSAVAGSPTSTLLGLSHLSRSPSMSPPMSPAASFSRRLMRSYKEEVMNELLGCMETMNIKEGSCSPSSPAAASTRLRAARMKNMSSPNNYSNWPAELNSELDFEHHQQVCVSVPPSAQNYIDITPVFGKMEDPDDGSGDPDLGWVNDLLT